ncbi:MAG TPA: AF1514 family protein [Desulfomonilaceae bacterium]|nr:AF1514 family protein [Desulfomonilaceae bacterium]
MLDTRKVTREMLIEPIDIRSRAGELSFSAAKSLADAAARNKTPEPVLLAWFDEKAWKHSPAVVCGCGEKPSWVVYAQSRGGTISVYLNDGEYVFVYKEST